MELQGQAFKNRKKWMPPNKKRQSNLEKYLSPNVSRIHERYETPISVDKMGVNCKTAFDLSFSSWLLILVIFTLSSEPMYTLKIIFVIIKQTSFIIYHSWNRWLSVCDTKGNKQLYPW